MDPVSHFSPAYLLPISRGGEGRKKHRDYSLLSPPAGRKVAATETR